MSDPNVKVGVSETWIDLEVISGAEQMCHTISRVLTPFADVSCPEMLYTFQFSPVIQILVLLNSLLLVWNALLFCLWL